MTLFAESSPPMGRYFLPARLSAEQFHEIPAILVLRRERDADKRQSSRSWRISSMC